MKLPVDLIKKTLLRNNFNLEWKDGIGYTIEQAKENDQNINLYYGFAVTVIIVGCLVLFTGSLWGIAFLGLSIPIFKKVSEQKKRQKNSFGIQIVIGGKQIKLNNKDESNIIELDTIEAINYGIEKDKSISSGVLIIKTQIGEYIPILEIFGDDKRYIEDDTKLIAQFFTDLINADIN